MNPRLVKEADSLSTAGFEVSVIAADFSPWAREADRCFIDRPWRQIRPLQFGPYASRRVRFLELIRRHAARLAVAAGVRYQPVIRAAWHPIAPALVTAARRVEADLYIAHYPAALPAAALAAAQQGARYAFDAEDFHLGDPPEGPEHEATRSMIRAIEGRHLPGCAYVTAASPGIADAYADAYGIPRPTVVLNVFPIAQAPDRPTPVGTAEPGPSVYWYSQTIGPDRGLECAVRAIGMARSRPHLYLRGTPAAGFVDRLRSLASTAGATRRLHVLPPAAPSEMERLAAGFDLGLVGETGHTPNRRIALTNKLFSYLIAGVPALLSDIPAHVAFARSAEGAACLYSTDDAASLAASLDSLLLDRSRHAEARATAWRLGRERFNWDVEHKKLLVCVHEALAGDRPTAQASRPKGSRPQGATVGTASTT